MANEKHALSTGSSRGIGRGIALALAEDQVKVGVHYYRNDPPSDLRLYSPSRVRFACGLFDELFDSGLATHKNVTASIDIRHKRIPGTPEIFIRTS